ncbi:TIGR03557 family F420-dependent LLM class oxidoreductase [Amycolatopsis sp. SID8362]|uniref:TIGR03557 family F420-dependent LLM class oxidoreductase n=1 Tax=Amycolatopsis sp. SID8362 TaxID=2690346 RepID=UPI00136DB3B6|nr:TIGR03557 family F420-dependent LLM class oxidoreductase [Amycolatopsis sp. SID8362]NBH09187.1 TIGR03557 family F420-dependent LLM class oxidoreductase [Amycolatopsis sp. SID8362]NED45880.1 TIGR03557 family F420-dependent LLM class oxidoreductase [Amycolatopsis sp. SID8362]
MRIGYTLMTEQTGPNDLVRFAAGAEAAGFDFEVMSDHYSPWLEEQGHAPYAWSVLGAVTQSTERVELMTYVTCPIMRYHPAVVAQKAATVQALSAGRFTLGLGAGENLNEHVVGRGWPPANVRHDMLAEAVQIIGGLFDGGHFDYEGKHFRVDSAKLWDLPEQRTPVAVAVSGSQSVRRFAPVADAMIAVEPKAELAQEWDATRLGPPARKIAQLPVSWGPDRDAAVKRAHEQFRWFAGGWKVNAELPGPAGFAGATQFVREEDVAGSIACGPDVEPIVEGVREFERAGFTDVALVQIGGDQQEGFLDFAEKELLPALRG